MRELQRLATMSQRLVRFVKRILESWSRSVSSGEDYDIEARMVRARDGRALDISLMFAIDGAKRENGQEDPRARFRSVSPGFFSTLGMPLLEGRDFRDTDKDGAERVVIISKSVADQLFPGQPALNREFRWTDARHHLQDARLDLGALDQDRDNPLAAGTL